MTKEIKKAAPVWFPEDGTDVERAAMAFHAVRAHPSTLVNRNGTTAPGSFVTNGSGRPVPGAPFHEPCIDDLGKLDIIVLKSRVHFWRGFVEDGLAKTVVVVDAPGLGPADVTTIPYKNAPKDIYPLVRK